MSHPEKDSAYGYVRAFDLPDDAVEALEKQLHEYAITHNLQLIDIYQDRNSALPVGRLVAWLQRSGIQHLIVPSAEHVSRHPIVWLLFCEGVYLDARAELHEACPEDADEE